MHKSVNKVILVGNVGQDPEVKYAPSGVALAKFSLATNEKFKDKSGKWQDRTEWHNVLAWQRLAEIVGEYVHKGAKLYIEGKLQTSNWEDRNSGEKKYGQRLLHAISSFLAHVKPAMTPMGTVQKTGRNLSTPQSAKSLTRTSRFERFGRPGARNVKYPIGLNRQRPKFRRLIIDHRQNRDADQTEDRC